MTMWFNDSSTVEKPVAVALDNDPDVKMSSRFPAASKLKPPLARTTRLGCVSE